VVDILNPEARQFLNGTAWSSAACEALTGDASTRKYFRLQQGGHAAILMDASALPQTVAPFIFIDQHLRLLGFSAPEIFVQDEAHGFLVLEDFGDATFARLLEGSSDPVALFAMATDVLAALHQQTFAIPKGLRTYHPDQMVADLELFLQWCTPQLSAASQAEFRSLWREVLPLAHQVPTSLLLRDFHAGNLMLLPERKGVRRAGLLDFQDAYAGPVTYDLMSLLEDARHDIPETIKEEMQARYLARFPDLAPDLFSTSFAIVAALRHTRVLAIFERLSRFESKHEYKHLHSARVQRLLQAALRHPVLAGVKHWMEQHAA
jgi:aminoglycoside/choline kinase family phosphotransferase